jgi:hypothetical protein
VVSVGVRDEMLRKIRKMIRITASTSRNAKIVLERTPRLAPNMEILISVTAAALGRNSTRRRMLARE